MKFTSYIFLLFLICSGDSLPNHEIGEAIDEFNGVEVFYNGKMRNVHGRHLTPDGYNLGLKWQCVEFVKRYYYYRFDHKMTSSYGHAKDFFDKSLPDKAFNKNRGLMQFRNTRYEKPKSEDIIIFDKTPDNPFGHIAIITSVTDSQVELIQQNWGSKSRAKLKLVEYNGVYTIAEFNVLGWLRKT